MNRTTEWAAVGIGRGAAIAAFTVIPAQPCQILPRGGSENGGGRGGDGRGTPIASSTVIPAQHCQTLPRGGSEHEGGRGGDGRGTPIASSTVIPAQAGIHRPPGSVVGLGVPPIRRQASGPTGSPRYRWTPAFAGVTHGGDGGGRGDARGSRNCTPGTHRIEAIAGRPAVGRAPCRRGRAMRVPPLPL